MLVLKWIQNCTGITSYWAAHGTALWAAYQSAHWYCQPFPEIPESMSEFFRIVESISLLLYTAGLYNCGACISGREGSHFTPFGPERPNAVVACYSEFHDHVRPFWTKWVGQIVIFYKANPMRWESKKNYAWVFDRFSKPLSSTDSREVFNPFLPEAAFGPWFATLGRKGLRSLVVLEEYVDFMFATSVGVLHFTYCEQ